MDLQGSLVDTNLKIYPTNNLLKYFKSLELDEDVPVNIIKFVKGKNYETKPKDKCQDTKHIPIHLNSNDIENLSKIRGTVSIEEEIIDLDNISKEVNTEDCTNSKGDSKEVKNISEKQDIKENGKGDSIDVTFLQDDINQKSKDNCHDKEEITDKPTKKTKEDCNEKINNEFNENEDDLHLITSDIDWLYGHLQKLRSNGGKNIPYLHMLLEGAQIVTPNNKIIKRNPVLEARCVKLRAQQEAREYRKMTKSVDNVRMRFPEDSISYQLKQVNRQLIAIGQFIISIFAGFLFGFKGVEWMIGQLDFGFRLLLGVMCALIIALAEIYFLAKKLNEELNIPETVQLGGPPKFVDQQQYFIPKASNKAIDKEHKD